MKRMKLTATTVMLAVVLLASCRTQRSVATDERAQEVGVAATHITTATNERIRWLSTLNIDVDNFEMVISDLPQPDARAAAAHDTATAAPVAPVARQPPMRSVVLRGKRAVIGKTDAAVSKTERVGHRTDTMAAHRTTERSGRTDTESTAVVKPPDLDEALEAGFLIAVMVALIGWVAFIYRERKEK